MILVIGGIASGKRTFAHLLGYSDALMSSNAFDDRPVLIDAQELTREESNALSAQAGESPDGLSNEPVDMPSDIPAFADFLANAKQVVLCCEVGSGIVPLDPAQRAWRDRAGTLMRELAERASLVVRMTCGIPQALKGDLPANDVEVIIMRHGTTEANERRVYAGSTDVPLTERGEREAREAGVCPQVEVVHVSPLTRARRTAQICFPNARQIPDDGLREMNFGAFEGRSAKDMERDEAYREWVDGMCEGRCPGGEKRAELVARVTASLTCIVRDALLDGQQRVVVVGHGGTIMAAMDALSPSERDYFDWQVGNCEGYRMRAHFTEDGLVLDNAQRFADLTFLGSETDCRQDEGHPQASASFFTNRACKFFPCHEGLDEADFNCLFCYCPLYALGPDCGGNFTYTDSGRKNCASCAIPHMRESGAKLVAAHYEQLAALASRKR